MSFEKDKPNLHRVDYLKDILNLPSNHPHKIKLRQSEGAGSSFIIDFEYRTLAAGAEITIYFKGYFGTNGTLMLIVQSYRKTEEE